MGVFLAIDFAGVFLVMALYQFPNALDTNGPIFGNTLKDPSLNTNRNYLYPDRTESKIIEKDAIMAFALSRLLKM